MVSNRCKMVVREELKKLGLHFIFLELGEVEVMENISEKMTSMLKMELKKSGLELLDDKTAILIESIKNTLIELIYKSDDVLKLNYPKYLSEKFQLDYTYLSDLFVAVQGVEIDQLIVSHKIERIKELIIYENLDIFEIVRKLNFESVASLHLQFLHATGFSPYNFKQMKMERRSIMDSIHKAEYRY